MLKIHTYSLQDYLLHIKTGSVVNANPEYTGLLVLIDLDLNIRQVNSLTSELTEI